MHLDSRSNIAYPDTLVGTDSHTTMIDGLGIVGFGVGGIEAEAALLNQPVSFTTPKVLGVHITGKLNEGVTAMDLALTLTKKFREKGVVGWFIEFYGEGVNSLSLPDRATISNMCPEYGEYRRDVFRSRLQGKSRNHYRYKGNYKKGLRKNS